MEHYFSETPSIKSKNREIKYKGLTSNRTWVYGNLIQGKKGDCYICSINENPIYKNGDSWYIDSPCYVVIPETIGQLQD